MKPAVSIPLYREINECHEATGFPLRSDLPEFHVFTLEETYPCPRQAMPPFRRVFYQLTYLETMGGATMNFESEALAGTENVLIFSPPEQVLSWVCGGTEQGFMLYFKGELFANLGQGIEETIPFFDPFAVNVLPLTREDRAVFRPQLERLRTVFRSAHPYRRPQLAALTTALLYDCRALHDRKTAGSAGQMEPSGLVTRFRQLVARCFQQHCSVDDYARCLHVSVDHLGAVVKTYRTDSGRNHRRTGVARGQAPAGPYRSQCGRDRLAPSVFGTDTLRRFFKRHTQRATPLTFRCESGRTATAAAVAVA